MSVNSLLFKNSLELNAQSINLSGIASGLIKVAPIITTSNIFCGNLYVERSKFCDQAGNIAVPSGPFTITNAPIYNYVLTGIDSTNASWQELPAQEPAQYLQTDTTSVKIYGSNAPAPGDVLIAISATEAEWGPQSGGGGSNIAAFLQTTGAPVNVSLSGPPSINQVLRATSATTAVWDNVIATNAAYANVAGYAISALHSQWSDDANIALTALTANVAIFALDGLHSDWADVANVAVLATNAVNADHTEWADFANLAAFAVDSTHTDWADFANSIPNTTVTPGVYGDATHVGKFTVNASGQLTQAANIAISFPAAGNLTGPVTSVGLATTITATGVSAQKYGNATSVPTFIVNSAGQLTQAANVAISFPAAGNLTGPITSVGLATSIAAQTGTGSTFVVQNTPTLTTPNIGAATGTSLNVTGQLTSTIVTGTAPLVVSSTTKVDNLYVDRSALADTVTTNANLTGPITSVGNATSIAAQTGTGSTFVVQTNPSITNPTISQITNTGVLTLPTTTDTLIGRSTTDTLTNKTITDNSNNVLSRGLWCNSGTGSVSTYASTNPISGYVLTATGVSTATWQASAAGGVSSVTGTTNQITSTPTTGAVVLTLPASVIAPGSIQATTTLAGTALTLNDTTNQEVFGTTNTTTVNYPAPPSSIILTMPNALSDTMIARNTTDTLTNKTLTTPVLTQPSISTPLTIPMTSTVTSGVDVNLTSTSNYYQYFTGSTVQRVNLPATSVIGQSYMIINTSSASLNVFGSDGLSSTTVFKGQSRIYIQTITNSVSVADWLSSRPAMTFNDAEFQVFDISDTTKIFAINAAGTTATRTTLTTSQTTDKVITLPDATDTLVGRATTDTLTNKTLTAPVISTIVNTGTLTLPTTTQTLVGRTTTDTLTNKTLTAPVISTISNSGTLTLPTGTQTLVGRTTTDTLTNKTLTLPVISSISNSGTLTLPTGAQTLVGRTTTDTLTNKTFTLPTFPGPVITPLTTTLSSASAINITSTSTYYQIITGTTIQRINMPSTSIIGQSYFFVNDSTQVNNVYGSAGGASWNFNAGNRYILIQTVTNGTATTDWNFIQILS